MTSEKQIAALLSLEGKVALVTGGSGGIGGAIVDLFGRAGAEVVSVDRPQRPAPVAAAHSEPCDLGNPREIEHMVTEVGIRHGRLDVIVHACGITRDARIWKLSEQDWSDVLRVNLDSAFHLLRGGTALLRAAGGGAVVLVSSINGERGKAGQANYCASKAGLIALARTAARELGHFGVRVNAIAPGLIRTPMTESLPAEVRDRAIAETALERAGEPEDVAAAALFLAAPASRHITGQVLRVDGGQLIA